MKKTYCEYSDEELEKMSEEEVEKINKCKDSDCFDCWGDRLSY